MKSFLGWGLATGLIFFGPAMRAVAPIPSLAGMVYHDYHSNITTRDDGEVSIRLNADGTASYLKSAIGSALDLSKPYVCILYLPPPDGTYTYTVNSDGTATLVVTSSDGTSYAATLAFLSPTMGTLVMTNPLANGSFFVTSQTAGSSYPVLNVSMQGTVTPGHPLSAGFVVPGADPREFLIRVVGPSLAQFGVTSAWAAANFHVYQGAEVYGNSEAIYPAWSSPASPQGYQVNPTAAFNRIFALVGAFPLLVGAHDSATVMRFPPGSYTVVAATAGSGDPGGDALIEVYAMP